MTAPPGTARHAPPSQYWTVKSWTPYLVKVIASVGSEGEGKLSCVVKRSISSISVGAAKVTSSQSGKAPSVAQCQPLPVVGSLPQWMPLRSPLMAASGRRFASRVEEAVAVAPLAASATLALPDSEKAAGSGTKPVPYAAASCAARWRRMGHRPWSNREQMGRRRVDHRSSPA